jgi:hypothetical protein
MTHPFLALVATVALVTGSQPSGSQHDGEIWLREAEGRLYSWPKPGAIVGFKVKTDVLEKTIENLRQQLPPNPTPDMVKAIDALRRISITGTLDTTTGAATTVVDIPIDLNDANRKEAVERTKSGIETMVTKSFETLPLHDPTLLRKDGKVLEATEQGDAIVVKVSGKDPGDETTIRMNRRRMLPESFENSGMAMQVRYTEVLPGRFAPAKMDIQLPQMPKSTVTYSYQRVGDLIFPSTVVVSLGATSAKIEFQSVRVETSKR